MRRIFLHLFTLVPLSAVTYPVHVFESYSRPEMRKMEIVGQVSARSHVSSEDQRRLLGYDNRMMMITVRLFEHEGLRLGDMIYIIRKDPDHSKYKNGYLIGQAEIFSIFKTEFQGWMLKATGNLSMVKKGYFIARPETSGERLDAWTLSKKGDMFRVTGDDSRAYQQYRKSLEKDGNRPETLVQLARLTYRSGRKEEAYVYLSDAWKKLQKFTDANEVLALPGLYLAWSRERLASSRITDRERLKEQLVLLSSIRHYMKNLEWFKMSFKSETLKMLENKGLPDLEFQYQIGMLYSEIYGMLSGRTGRKNSLQTVLAWLNESERKILYEPIPLPYSESKFSFPAKAWDNAFFDASLYHFQIAHELNPLDNRSSFQIVVLSYEMYQRNPPRAKKEAYGQLILHFSGEYERVPFKDAELQAVRRIREAVSRG